MTILINEIVLDTDFQHLKLKQTVNSIGFMYLRVHEQLGFMYLRNFC